MRSAFFSSSTAFMLGNAISTVVTSPAASSPWRRRTIRTGDVADAAGRVAGEHLALQILDLGDAAILAHRDIAW